MVRHKKTLVMLVLIFWVMGMIAVGRGYERLTLKKLPTLAASWDRERVSIMAFGENYQVILVDKDREISILTKYYGLIMDRYGKTLKFIEEQSEISMPKNLRD